MQISHEQLEDDVYKINLVGRLDIQGNEEISLKFSEIIAAPSKLFIIDLSGVDFIASIGIRTILMSAKAIHNQGGKIVLLNPDSQVRKILSVSGVGTIMEIVDDLESALVIVRSSDVGA